MANIATDGTTKSDGKTLTARVGGRTVNSAFLEEVRSIPGGEGVDACIQCGTCSGSCPNANEMDYAPRELIAMIRAGMRDQVLASNAIWYCISCYLCTVRCPRGIRQTDLMYVLKNMAAQQKMTRFGSRPVALARSFVNAVNLFGRAHEPSLLFLYYLRTNPLKALPMVPVALKLLLRGRLSILPRSVKNKSQLEAIVRKAHALGGL